MPRLSYALLAFCLFMPLTAQAEQNTYDPLAKRTWYTYQADKEDGKLGAANLTPRNKRVAKQLVLDERYRETYPTHPGQYRDAYDRGGFRQTKSADFYGWNW